MAEKHYEEQIRHTKEYLIPYLDRHLPDWRQYQILEVGCAEGGFLSVLRELGVNAVGVELEPDRVETARRRDPLLQIEVGDITDSALAAKWPPHFDLIVMRDVIEHVPERDAAFANLSRLLKPGGYLYVTFPPRFSAFAGHQQNGRTILKRFPYLHLLPDFAIRFLGQIFGESKALIAAVIHNFRTGLTIRRFENLYNEHEFTPVVQELFWIRPVFKIRFGLTPRRFPNIPFFREFLALGCEYLLRK